MKIFIILCMLFGSFCFPQQGFKISGKSKTVIPFRLINNLIFIPLNINGANLTFLLDSGVNETILFSLDNQDVNFNDIEKVKFAGLGGAKSIEGLRSDNNTIEVGENFKDSNHTIFIILDESINFSAHVGIPVNGIIGHQFFKNNPVKIDYITKKITVYTNLQGLGKKLNRFKELPITIEGNKPYLIAGVEEKDQRTDSKMLLDLGNSDAVWLFPKLIKDFIYNRPNIDDYLGQGFNGDIFGKRSRIHRLYIGEFTLEKPLTAMPDEYSIQNLKLVPDRKGSVGSEILRRFTVLFDYPQKKLYLRKNRHYKDPFLFNKSGLDIQHDGMTWENDLVKVQTAKGVSNGQGRQVIETHEDFQYNFVLKSNFSVAGCRKDSPCDIAGIKIDDKLIRINRKKVGEMTLQRISEIMKDEDGTHVNLEIERKGQLLNINIILMDPIPYQNEN